MPTEQRRWILTGGIASGKSAVRRFLERGGIATIDSDAIGHEVLQGPALAETTARWPSVVRDGAIDRSALGEIVFGDLRQLRELEAITHPHIFDTIRARVQEIHGAVIVEVPLLEVDLGGEWRWIVVDSDDEARVSRLLERGLTREQAAARMSAQPSRSDWLGRADVVVPNHGDLGDLEETVGRLAPALG